METTTTFEPPDAASAAALLLAGAADGRALVPAGSRTKLRARASASSGAATISTVNLTTGLAHYAGDLVATAPAGATLHDVNAALAMERQWIPLDPPHGPRATIGGIVACNDSGPRRHRFGAPRDLIIGIEVALTNGRVVHAGGRVVKNVAGYDLARLFCGSRGSLGLITAVTFKLAPLATVSRTLVAEFDDVPHAMAAALQVAASASLTPSALELAAPRPRVLVRFETTPRSADHMATAARALLLATGGRVTDHGSADDVVWSEHSMHEDANRGLVVHLSVLPSRTAAAVQQIEHLAIEHGLEWSLTGRAGLGALRVTARGSNDAQAALATAIRTLAKSLDGWAQVRAMDADAEDESAALDSAGSADAVAAAVKHRFDPTGVLPYPWVRA